MTSEGTLPRRVRELHIRALPAEVDFDKTAQAVAEVSSILLRVQARRAQKQAEQSSEQDTNEPANPGRQEK